MIYLLLFVVILMMIVAVSCPSNNIFAISLALPVNKTFRWMAVAIIGQTRSIPATT